MAEVMCLVVEVLWSVLMMIPGSAILGHPYWP